MQESEHDYHSRPTSRKSRPRYEPDIDRREEEEWEENSWVEEAVAPPQHGLLYALLAGGVGGVIALLIPVLIPLLNASLFRQASQLGDKMSLQMADAITAWQCGGVFLDLVVAFMTGYVVGRIAVRRRLGFYAGLLLGAIAYLGNILVHYIPGYPDRLVSTTAPSGVDIARGIVGILILLALWMVVGGLMAAWGARMATRRHPYYTHPKEAS